MTVLKQVSRVRARYVGSDEKSEHRKMTLKEGDHVHWKDPRKGQNTATKLSLAFKGPYVVEKVLPTGIAIIKVGSKERRVPIEQLRLVPTRT